MRLRPRVTWRKKVSGMRRNIRRLLAAALTAALAAVLLAVPASASAGRNQNRVLRVGLYYGSDAMIAANLDNADGYGSGHRFGYFEGSDNRFVELARTGQDQITVLKAVNLYLSADGSYTEQPSGRDMIGCYHLLAGSGYPDYQTAQAAADQLDQGFVAWVDGAYQVRYGSYASPEEAQAAAYTLQGMLGVTAEVVWTSQYAVTVVRTRTTEILFQFDGGSASALGIMPDITGSPDPQTWFRNNRYRGGFRYQRVGGGNLTVVNVVALEDYVKGVIPYEMSGSWPVEALKAQAVAARTYAVRNLDAHRSYGFDVCNTTHCQVYYGTGNASHYPTDRSDQAAEATWGEFLWYNGELASTNFASSNGGASESAENVWGNSFPYLVGRMDPYETSIADRIPGYRWSVTFTADQLTSILQSKNYGNSKIVDFQVTKRTPTGNVQEIRFTDSAGRNYTFALEKVRTLLGLRSARYEVTASGSAGAGTTVPPGTASGGSGYNINGDTPTSSLSGMYSITGNGAISSITGSKQYAVTGSGTISALDGTGGGTSSTVPPASAGSRSFTLTGTGYGHHVGMSQWGAYAMAEQGLSYRDILSFYYSGTYISANP